MSRIQRIETLLRDTFTVHSLDVCDQSHLHAGHYDAKGEEGTHLLITMSAQEFADLSLLERQRQVNALLAVEFETGLHAVSLKLS